MPVKQILTSLGITICISAALAYVLTFFGVGFIRVFALIFILHFFVFGIINYFAGISAAVKVKILETEQLKSLDSQGAYVECAFCGKPSFVPVILNSPNSYTCPECQKDNTILIAVEAAQPTDPIEDLNPSKIITDALQEE